MTTRVGQVQTLRSARGAVTSYSRELWHDGLKKHRLIKSSDFKELQRKSELQAQEWEGLWSAAKRTSDAQDEIERLINVLRDSLSANNAIDWEQLKDRAPFRQPAPEPPTLICPPVMSPSPPEPGRKDFAYFPKLGILDRLLSSRRERIIADCLSRFESDHAHWKLEVSQNETAHAAALAEHALRTQERQSAYLSEKASWDSMRAEFRNKKAAQHEGVDKLRSCYVAGSAEAIVEYCRMVLSASSYPDYFPQEAVIDYNSDAKILLVEYFLPGPNALPTLKEVKYNATKNEFSEYHLSQPQLDKIYDQLIYQVTLRTVHELFDADVIKAIDAIVFNGFVAAVDRGTGQEITSCIISLQVSRDEFMAVNLANVDPRACFKALKGVGSSKLHSLAAVAPIMQVRRDDGRFVASHEVANTLDESSNLAAMDWEDFEHLIRELFEKEFRASGGEVKVTQASRDGGVDAVVFDPDPIRGGKIVVQAKRYTNTVSVSAVRDLYGTVLNEGATKGVLVTTADFGPDAYTFAKGKPLTLLNGANLLHLLEKHGHRVRIDLAEARKINGGRPIG